MAALSSAFYYALCFLMGASVFSFLNVVAYRVERGLPFVKGRSLCPACGHVLGPADLIPVLGFLLLRGRCRYCGGRLSRREPLVEALGGLLLIACLVAFGGRLAGFPVANLGALAAFALLSVLALVALVDGDTLEIPNGFIFALLVPALLCAWAFPGTGLWARGAGALCASLPMLVLALCIPGAFGGGDIKLMAVLGFALGWRLTLLTLLLAVFTGGGYAIYLLLAKKKKRGEQLAFGPFLCLGAALSLFFGEGLIAWYMGFFS